MRIALCAAKGGVGKTTTAALLALEAARRGQRVLLADGDPDQQSLASWRELAGADWPHAVELVSCSSPEEIRQLRRRGPRDGHLIVDAGPRPRDLLLAARDATEEILIPVAPAPIEVRELRSTLSVLNEGQGAAVRVLLSRTRAGTSSRESTRAALRALSIPVLNTEVPLRESIAQAPGSVPPGPLPPFPDLLEELS